VRYVRGDERVFVKNAADEALGTTVKSREFGSRFFLERCVGKALSGFHKLDLLRSD
jgi:hypothetical protein